MLTASSQRSRERTESSTDDKLDSVGDDSTARPEQGGSIHDANASTDGVDDDGDGDGDSEMSSDAVPTDNPRLVIVPPVDLHMNTAVAEDVISAYRWYMLFFTVDTVLLVYLTCGRMCTSYECICTITSQNVPPVSQILTGNNALLIAHIVSILAYIVGGMQKAVRNREQTSSYWTMFHPRNFVVFGSLTGNTLLLTIGTVAASVQSGYFIILAFHPIQLLHGLCAALLCWSARRLARELVSVLRGWVHARCLCDDTITIAPRHVLSSGSSMVPYCI